jgi:o-succinylbenzoate synthase
MHDSIQKTLIASWKKTQFQFKRPSGTSRGILTQRASWFIKLYYDDAPNVIGIGECAPLVGLSHDDILSMDDIIERVCNNVNDKNILSSILRKNPSVKFGLEMATIDLKTGGKQLLFNSSFTAGTAGIPINGLIWMGSPKFIYDQIYTKIDAGFNCIKMKIGAIDFQQELEILKTVRGEFSIDLLELRVDANGAFSPAEAQDKLNQLAEFELHSIEQPIAAGQKTEMAKLCQNSPFPIALDEELIGIHEVEEKEQLLDYINPQYLIIKPTLLGGFAESIEWINLANMKNIPWWVTSALESNIGLNSIAQWTAQMGVKRTQGLGTGQLFINNIPSPLLIEQGRLNYNQDSVWDLAVLDR